jgi:hypothetical protein
MKMRDCFQTPTDERAPTFERPFLEVPPPSYFEPPPNEVHPDEEEESERVIIIDI